MPMVIDVLYIPYIRVQTMGSGNSKASQEGWKPSPSGGVAERKFSKAGYDITPLTQEEIKRYSAQLTPFQRLGHRVELVCNYCHYFFDMSI